jgi:hypothetical protein
MRITGKSIRKLETRLGVSTGTEVAVAIVDLDGNRETLRELGFDNRPRSGDAVLPPARGPVSRKNAEGEEVVHKDRPKEWVWRLVNARWIEWHGPYAEEHFGVRPRRYKRYPRTQLPPVGFELVATELGTGAIGLVLGRFVRGRDDESLLFAINLLLEVFGEAEILDADLVTVFEAPMRRLNWKILPRGRRPWSDLQRALRPVVDTLDSTERPVADYRLQLMHSFEPDFTAVGRGGFRGYVIFGFEGVGRYVLESLYYGNATYVLGENWERISSMTKAEILTESLHEVRIVHTRGWERQLRRAIGG